MRIRTLVLMMVAMALSGVSLPATAWEEATHRKMTTEAWALAPTSIKNKLFGKASKAQIAKFVQYLTDTSVECDRFPQDRPNHFFQVEDKSYGKGPFRLESMIKYAADEIRKGRITWEKIRLLGWIAHYAADMNEPFHSGAGLTRSFEDTPTHKKYEKLVDRNLGSLSARFDQIDLSDRIAGRWVYEALWANNYADGLEETLKTDSEFASVKKETWACYNRSVNSIIDAWAMVLDLVKNPPTAPRS